jgi:hypothetical protein
MTIEQTNEMAEFEEELDLMNYEHHFLESVEFQKSDKTIRL